MRKLTFERRQRAACLRRREAGRGSISSRVCQEAKRTVCALTVLHEGNNNKKLVTGNFRIKIRRWAIWWGMLQYHSSQNSTSIQDEA